MSVWGQADKLKVSFDATKVGIEGLSQIFSDMPIMIDEKQIDNRQSKVEETVYMFANGKSKLRGTRNGSMQKLATWRALAICTGEEPLSSNQSQDGVRSRVLEIFGKPFVDEKTASKMYEFTEQNYGMAGKKFLNLIIDDYAENDYLELKKLYVIVKNKLKAICPKINFAQLSYIGLVTLTDILIGRYFFNTDINSSLEMAKSITENISSKENKDNVDHAYKSICDWILSNRQSFEKFNYVRQKENSNKVMQNIVSNPKGSVSLGVVEDGLYYIWVSKFDAKLQQLGFNSGKIKQGFQDRGYIVTDSKSKYTKKLLYNGNNVEFIALKLSNDDEVDLKLIDKEKVNPFVIKPQVPTMEEIMDR